MPRGQSPTQLLAVWFWDEILDGGQAVIPGLTEPLSFWDDKAKRLRGRVLGNAKTALKTYGLDVDVLKEACRRAKADPVMRAKMSGPLFPNSWHVGKQTLYDVVLAESLTPPPVYQPHALREWAEKYNRPEIIEFLDNGCIS